MKTVNIYNVEVRVKSYNYGYRPSWDIDVIADNVRDARRKGVNIMVELGYINKYEIKSTDVVEAQRGLYI